MGNEISSSHPALHHLKPAKFKDPDDLIESGGILKVLTDETVACVATRNDPTDTLTANAPLLGQIDQYWKHVTPGPGAISNTVRDAAAKTPPSSLQDYSPMPSLPPSLGGPCLSRGGREGPLSCGNGNGALPW